jgi:uncharacterized protein DUF4154
MARRINNDKSAWGDAPVASRAVDTAPLHARLCLSKAMHALQRCAFCVISIGWVFILTAAVSAQVSKEYQLKAVFLLRLAQFTQWPGDAFENAESLIAICVLGDNPFGDALEAAVRGETAHGRGLVVRHIRAVEQARSCQVIYIGGAGPRQSKEIAAALAGRSVLTVRDADGLPSAYETIIGFVTEQNRVRLRVNLKAAAAARIVLDPRLLRAAEVVAE